MSKLTAQALTGTYPDPPSRPYEDMSPAERDLAEWHAWLRYVLAQASPFRLHPCSIPLCRKLNGPRRLVFNINGETTFTQWLCEPHAEGRWN